MTKAVKKPVLGRGLSALLSDPSNDIKSEGIVTIIWLITSGGVTIAAIIKIITYAHFLYSLKNAGVTNPKEDRK